MKKSALASILTIFYLSLHPLRADDPAVVFPDATGTNAVEIADDYTIQFQDIPAATPMYTAWGVWKVLSEIGVSCDCGKKTVALFILPLNPSGRPKYTDFELKASTNNFYHGASSQNDMESGRLLYWGVSTNLKNAMSDEPFGFPSNAWDNVWAFSGNGNSIDGRSWAKWKELDYSATPPNGKHVDYEYPRYVAVLVHPSMIHGANGSRWLISGNTDIVWSYLRVSDGGPEKMEGTDIALWTVCEPVRWFDERNLPNWIQEYQENVNGN